MSTKNACKPIIALILNGLIPVLFGGIIYIIWRDKSLLMFQWFETINLSGFIAVLRNISVSMPDWFVFSLPGGLWAYSFMFFISFIWGANYSLGKNLFIVLVIVLSMGSEIFQLFGLVPGTFCLNDIALYILGLLAGYKVGLKYS